jgi:hypothetical protein
MRLTTVVAAAIWTMDGTTITAGAVLPYPGSDWHLL